MGWQQRLNSLPGIFRDWKEAFSSFDFQVKTALSPQPILYKNPVLFASKIGEKPQIFR
ncbi:hypothetical protein SAMN06265795_102501 [Noviherbaspirillum humi]|uniref:Uncharacterized protein n=1 Tax=Noviherbaspirillum humi TaxID=1688639 RepID=A0A239E4W5_9BURK|nr:hypothetical protein SAMN06265795_102501 [Noviherbaspirillum humi]